MGSLTYKVREPLFRLQRYEKYYHYKQKNIYFLNSNTYHNYS